MDLSNYRLVFEDHFDGDELDTTKWHHMYTGAKRQGGYLDQKAVRVQDGKLVIRHEFRDGECGKAWYSGFIASVQTFCRGYFEVRAMCSETVGVCQNTPLSAFWLWGPGSLNHDMSRGGPGAAEIDVFESNLDLGMPGIVTNIHVAGKKGGNPDSHDSCFVGGVTIPDCYRAYHTYALEWTKEEYRFFVDGVCYGTSAWGDGVSEVGEWVYFSLEPPGTIDYPEDFSCEFKVDYIKIYQKD